MDAREVIEKYAIRCAKGNNGGEWEAHYTEDQKEFWRAFVRDLSADMSSWRPIETAPKEDGTVIIGFSSDNLCGDCKVMDLWWSTPESGWWDHYDYYGPHKPTHWMPMPDLPK